MHYTQYFIHHVDLLKKFKHDIGQLPPYQINLSDLTESDQTFMRTLDTLCTYQEYDEKMIEQGQWLVERIISGYNHLLQHFSRDLLWFFGGSCLHHMPDDEIHFYQQLDELRHASESQDRPFNIEEAKEFLNKQI